jgi:hypothetical protein
MNWRSGQVCDLGQATFRNAKPNTSASRMRTMIRLSSWRFRVLPVAVVALRTLQRDALRTLLQNGTGHISLVVELELEDRPSRVREARL